MGGDPRRRCVSVVIQARNARHGERCSSDGSVRVSSSAWVCASHHRHGWIHHEMQPVEDAIALRMKAVADDS